MAEVIAYVDGWNLYHGIRANHGRKHLWLDLEHLVTLLRVDDDLIKVRYVTAAPNASRPLRATGDLPRCSRPALPEGRGHTRALQGEDLPLPHVRTAVELRLHSTYGVQDIRGEAHRRRPGVSMVEDAALGLGGLSMLVSSDTDFHPAVDACLRLGRRVMLVCPPGKLPQRDRFAGTVTSFHIPESHLADAQLPDAVRGPGGRLYQRPAKWS